MCIHPDRRTMCEVVSNSRLMFVLVELLSLDKGLPPPSSPLSLNLLTALALSLLTLPEAE